MGYYALRLCAGGGAFEAVPAPRLSLDLGEARRTLEHAGVPVVDARVMLILQLDHEVTLSRDGRVLIKTKDPDRAAQSFAHLARLLDLPSLGPSSSGSGQ